MNIKNIGLLLCGAAAALAFTRFEPARHALDALSAGAPATSQGAASGNASVTSGSALAGLSSAAPAPASSPLPAQPAAAGASIDYSRRTAIVTAVEKAAPAVVSITVRRSAVVAYENQFFQDPFFDFFGPQYRRKEMSSLGSGVIVSASGDILTNSHVIGAGEGGDLLDVTVTLADGRQFPAKVVGADPANDLAVIRIKAQNLPVAQLQERADNMIGEWVVAIGNPYGYLIGDTKPTVTVGVISAVSRTFSSNSGIHYHNMIQTDASINPGNSGGALVNAEGRLIGINTFILTGGGQSQGSIGLGFAIPVQKARLVMDELIKYGYIREFTTGLYADPQFEGNVPGVMLAGVDPGSPGAKAGLRKGDVIHSVAGKRIENFQDIQDVFKLFQVGEAVEIIYLRGSEQLQTRLVLEELKKKRKMF
jgi:serine protease Do